MPTRKIITIDEELCDGCGDCVTTCAEGALRLVNGKAKLASDVFCDGFGDCIGECHTGALKIEEREADDFDFEATRQHVAGLGGAEAVRRLEDAAVEHEKKHAKPAGLPMAGMPMPTGGGCPGQRPQFRPDGGARRPEPTGAGGPKQAIPSELQQWPIQLHLVQPGAPFFRDREMVILNTCGAVASADVHWRFIRGRSVVVACPKLDDTTPYAHKLGAILREPSIPKATVVRMEVPCCGGLTSIASEAKTLSGRGDLVVEEVTIGTNGDILRTEAV
jgi:ferredoxin